MPCEFLYGIASRTHMALQKGAIKEGRTPKCRKRALKFRRFSLILSLAGEDQGD